MTASHILNALLHDPRSAPDLLDPHAFASTADFLGAIDEALGVAKQPIPVSGANAADCEKAIETMRTTFALVRSLVRDTLRNLNENLPVTATVDFEDQYFLLLDIEGDLVGKIANAAEQI